MKKLLWLVNPHAGKGVIEQHALACIDVFVRAGWDVTVYTTQGPGDATRYLRERAGAFDRIVCAGGDGTLDETISGVMELADRPEIAYIPAGTTNDFAASLELPKTPVQAAEVAMNSSSIALDIGRFEDRYFIYVAAFGLFTDVSYSTPQNIKNWLGRAAYVLEGIKSLSQLRVHRLRVETEKETIEGEFIYGMVSNATSVGGFKGLLDGAAVALDDGVFEIVLIRVPESIAELQEAINRLIQQGSTDSTLLVQIKASEVRFYAEDPVAWTLDGEFGGDRTEACIGVVPHAIRFITRHDTALPAQQVNE